MRNAQNPEHEKALAEYLENSKRLMDVFYKVSEAFADKGFTADEVYCAAQRADLEDKFVRNRLPNLFKIFQKHGIIRKLAVFRLSNRNDSKPLPVWITTRDAGRTESVLTAKKASAPVASEPEQKCKGDTASRVPTPSLN